MSKKSRIKILAVEQAFDDDTFEPVLIYTVDVALSIEMLMDTGAIGNESEQAVALALGNELMVAIKKHKVK